MLRDYEDGLAIAPPDFTVKDAIGEWLRYGFSSRDQQTVSYNVPYSVKSTGQTR